MEEKKIMTTSQPEPSDSLEVKLAYHVRSCRACTYFWPENGKPQPYGPFPSYDFNADAPDAGSPPELSGEKYPPPWPWVEGTTVAPGFPKPEIMDGCRKAPIMTIGINPNLTAFAPGQQGASWCYPEFTSRGGTDEWSKYAFYYRYRTVYQECMDMDFIRRYLLEEGRIIAENSGVVVSAPRENDSPDFSVTVRYDDADGDTVIPLKREAGSPRYVLLFNTFHYNSRFEKGDIIAARLNVPAGLPVQVNQQQIGYYEQFVPVLDEFRRYLEKKGFENPLLEMGEDVCQLDMVACASPHWNPSFLGGTEESENSIIENCVSHNIWAVKQFVQTVPAVLFLVGESSYNMFKEAFGNHIHCEPPLPAEPEDYAFTLLRATTERNCVFSFSAEIDGRKFEFQTRLVVSPHFSYNSNFLPQFRMSQSEWYRFREQYGGCYEYLTTDKRIIVEVPSDEYQYVSIQLVEDAEGVFENLKGEYDEALPSLMTGYYSAHTMLAGVLEELTEQGKISYKTNVDGKPGCLGRGDGGCRFCTNAHWSFPGGCPYGKTGESAPGAEFLEKVAQKLVATGKS
jgi:hypothetical protein